jgi:hypothetical protein
MTSSSRPVAEADDKLRTLQDRLDQVTRDINDGRRQLGWDRDHPEIPTGEPPTKVAPRPARRSD